MHILDTVTVASRETVQTDQQFNLQLKPTTTEPNKNLQFHRGRDEKTQLLFQNNCKRNRKFGQANSMSALICRDAYEPKKEQSLL